MLLYPLEGRFIGIGEWSKNFKYFISEVYFLNELIISSTYPLCYQG